MNWLHPKEVTLTLQELCASRVELDKKIDTTHICCFRITLQPAAGQLILA